MMPIAKYKAREARRKNWDYVEKDFIFLFSLGKVEKVWVFIKKSALRKSKPRNLMVRLHGLLRGVHFSSYPFRLPDETE